MSDFLAHSIIMLSCCVLHNEFSILPVRHFLLLSRMPKHFYLVKLKVKQFIIKIFRILLLAILLLPNEIKVNLSVNPIALRDTYNTTHFLKFY